MALLEQRVAEYEAAVAQRTAERLERLAAKHEAKLIESRDGEDLVELSAAKGLVEAYRKE